MIVRILAGASLLICLLSALLFFNGRVSEGAYKAIFAFASLGWFVFATLAIRRRKGA